MSTATTKSPWADGPPVVTPGKVRLQIGRTHDDRRLTITMRTSENAITLSIDMTQAQQTIDSMLLALREMRA